MTSHTTTLQEACGLPAQRQDELDVDFQRRIAGALRDMGKLIEAHEALHNARYDSGSDNGVAITGVMGAIAQALQGINYGVSGRPQVECDHVAGEYLQKKKKDIPVEMLEFLLGIPPRQ